MIWRIAVIVTVFLINVAIVVMVAVVVAIAIAVADNVFVVLAVFSIFTPAVSRRVIRRVLVCFFQTARVRHSGSTQAA